MTDALVVRDGLRFELTAAAKEAVEQALNVAALLGHVTNDEENELACKGSQACADVIAAFEKQRKTVKAPLLEAGRQLDDTVRRKTDMLAQRRAELDEMASTYQSMLMARQRAEEAARVKELREAERQRQEELAKAQTSDEKDEIDAKYDEQASKLPPVVHIATPEGQRVKEDWDYKVTDVWALARTHPGLVSIKPRHSEIIAALNSGVKLAGIEATKVVKAGTRGSSKRVEILI